MSFLKSIFSFIVDAARQVAWASHKIFSIWTGRRWFKYFLLLALYLVSLIFVTRFSGYPALAILMIMVLLNLGINIFYFEMRSEEQEVIDGLLFRKEDETTVIQSGVMGDVSEVPIPPEAPRTSFLTRENEKLYTPGVILVTNAFQIICFGCICAEIYRISGSGAFTSNTHPTFLSWLIFTLENVFRAADIVDFFEAYGVQFRDIQYHGIFAGTIVAIFRLLVDILLIQAIAQYVAFEKRKNKVIQALAIDSENAKLQAKRIGDSIIPNVIEALNSQNMKTREQAIELLGQMKAKQAIPFLNRLLEDKDEEIRVKVIKAFKHINDKSVIPHLTKWLYDSELRVECAAIETIGEMGDKSALPYLHKKFDEAIGYPKQCVAQALKNFMDTENIKFLRDRLCSLEPEIEREVLSSLHTMAMNVNQLENANQKKDIKREFSNTVETLIHILKNQSSLNRDFAALVLGEIKDKNSKQVFIDLLDDKNENVQLAIIEALREFHDASVIPILEKKLTNENPIIQEVTKNTIGLLQHWATT